MAEHAKTQKLKGSDVDTETAAQEHMRRLQPGAQGVGKEGDAIDESGNVDPEKLKQNQERKCRRIIAAPFRESFPLTARPHLLSTHRNAKSA